MDTNESSSYYWLPKTLLGEVGNMSPSKLVPQISTPFSTTPLGELVYLLQNAMKHNFLSSVLVSGGIMALHYENIREIFGGCPVVVATGNPETGKSTSMKAVAALYGLMDNGMHGKMTQALVHERSSVSSIPFVIDDPPKSSSRYNTVDINDVIVDSYNGLMSGNAKSGCARPMSSAMISTNYDIKSDARISTRAVLIPFADPIISTGTEEDDATFDKLEKMFRSGELSKVIGWVISLGSNVISCRDELTVYKTALRGNMSGRKLQNWAILLHFTKQVIDCVENTGVDMGVDIGDFIAFAEKPGCTNTSKGYEDNQGDILQTTLQEFILACKDKSLSEVNVFAHTKCDEKLEGKKHQVLSIVLHDIWQSLSHSCEFIAETVIAKGFGVRSNKDFLKPGCTGAIRRGPNSIKRRCIAIYLSKLDDDIRQQVVEVTTKERENQQKHSEKWDNWEPGFEDILSDSDIGIRTDESTGVKSGIGSGAEVIEGNSGEIPGAEIDQQDAGVKTGGAKITGGNSGEGSGAEIDQQGTGVRSGMGSGAKITGGNSGESSGAEIDQQDASVKSDGTEITGGSSGEGSGAQQALGVKTGMGSSTEATGVNSSEGSGAEIDQQDAVVKTGVGSCTEATGVNSGEGSGAEIDQQDAVGVGSSAEATGVNSSKGSGAEIDQQDAVVKTGVGSSAEATGVNSSKGSGAMVTEGNSGKGSGVEEIGVGSGVHDGSGVKRSGGTGKDNGPKMKPRRKRRSEASALLDGLYKPVECKRRKK